MKHANLTSAESNFTIRSNVRRFSSHLFSAISHSKFRNLYDEGRSEEMLSLRADSTRVTKLQPPMRGKRHKTDQFDARKPDRRAGEIT